MASDVFIFQEKNNPLEMLNELADLVIGNEPIDDEGFKGCNTVPEILAYALMNPHEKSIAAARRRIKMVIEKAEAIDQQLVVLSNRAKYKRKKY